jgi:uncharacterized protein YecT (DUF1311 family)
LEDEVQECAMTTFLPLAMFLLIFSAASSAQQNAKPAAQATQANPCESPTTQMEMNQCSGEEYRTADADLNAVYKNLLRKLQQSADEAHQQKDEEQQKDAETAIQKLRAAQRQWIQYRDLHCDAVKQRYEGGSMSPLIWSTCLTETTNHRIAELKSGYELE